MQDAFATEPTLSENERLDYVNDQLKLIQRTDGLTFGTDALLLAAYIGDGYRQALEIGAGSGILSLLLATRGKAEHITAVEIQPEYAELTARNVLCNRLSDKIGTVCRDVRDIPTPEIERYDLVFTNPPYLTCGSGRLCGLAQKSAARHEVHGTLTELLGAAARVTIHGGGSGVFDFGIGHHTYGALTDTAQNFSNIFLAGIIEGSFRAVTVHAERVNARLMARHVSRSGVG